MRNRLIALALSFSLVYVAGCGGPHETEDGGALHGVVVRIDTRSGDIRERIPVGQNPFELRLAAGQIWIQTFGSGRVTRIDPSTNEATAIDVQDVAGIASEGDDVWIAHEGIRLSVFDGATGDHERSLEVGRRPLFAVGDAGFPAVGGGSVWLTVPRVGEPDARQVLWRIDPGSGRVADKITIGPEPIPPFVAGGYVWVITPDTLFRVDMSSGAVRRLAVADGPFGLTAADGSVWMGHESPPVVWRLDPSTGERTAEIEIGEPVRGLAFGGGRVWVTTGTGVVPIDPATSEAGRKITLTGPSPDEGPIGVAYLDGDLWVSVE